MKKLLLVIVVMGFLSGCQFSWWDEPLDPMNHQEVMDLMDEIHFKLPDDTTILYAKKAEPGDGTLTRMVLFPQTLWEWTRCSKGGNIVLHLHLIKWIIANMI